MDASPGVLTGDLRTWEPDFDSDVLSVLGASSSRTDGRLVAAAKRAKRSIAISTTRLDPQHVHNFNKDSLGEILSDREFVHRETQVDPSIAHDTYGI
jgi:transposase